MADFAPGFLSSAFGFLLQELLWWYRLRQRLATQEYDQLVRSKSYWVITLLIAFGCRVFAIIWFHDRFMSVSLRDFFLFGASVPVLVKQSIAAGSEKIHLGKKGGSYLGV
ncbi:MAG TPA: hypothetical protein VED40_19215 [Azospirillaceae bacterium]|nr:hypothetical protein [Azospirillaceae bacterium]